MNIAGYETVRLLGKGGMSEVYEVVNTRLGSRHALKLFTFEQGDDDVRRRFETEGRLLAKLSHPRIVRVTDFGVDAEAVAAIRTASSATALTVPQAITTALTSYLMRQARSSSAKRVMVSTLLPP